MIKDFKIPTTEIELLSGAKLYKNIPPIIEIENMVTEDEDLLYSNIKDNGDTFKKLVQQKIKTQGVKVEDLLIGDFNQILIHIRCSGYGEDYQINTFDSDLDDYVTKTIDLKKLNRKELGDGFNENGEYSLNLPISGYDIKFILPTVGLGDIINKEAESKVNKITGVVPYITTKLEHLITSVNDITDKNSIRQFIKIMSPKDRLVFSKKIDEVEPDILLKWTFETEINKTKYDTDFMLGLDFFYPQN